MQDAICRARARLTCAMEHLTRAQACVPSLTLSDSSVAVHGAMVALRHALDDLAEFEKLARERRTPTRLLMDTITFDRADSLPSSVVGCNLLLEGELLDGFCNDAAIIALRALDPAREASVEPAAS